MLSCSDGQRYVAWERRSLCPLQARFVSSVELICATLKRTGIHFLTVGLSIVAAHPSIKSLLRSYKAFSIYPYFSQE